MNDKNTGLINLINFGFESLQDVFANITNGITITDENAKVLYVNPAFTKITGYSREEAIGSNPGILHSGKHGKEFYQEMWIKIHNNGSWAGEVWNRHKQGYLIPEWLTITKLVDNNKSYYIAIFSDITSLVQKNNQKLYLACSDPLTGLYNRTYLREIFKQYNSQLERDSRNQNIISNQIVLLFIDVNKFKLINDEHGHLAGDQALKHIAEIIKLFIRKVDVAIRYGGDEFIILLNKIKNHSDVVDICYRIKDELKKPLIYENKKINIEISIGASFCPSDSNNLDELIDFADQAMYKSKKSGEYLNYFQEDCKLKT